MSGTGATRSHGADDAAQEGLFDATVASVRERLGLDADTIGDLDEVQLATALGNAKSLAQKALAFLHSAQRRARALVEAAVEKAFRQERFREEWRRREQWVKSQSVQRQGPKKGRNKTRAVKPLPGFVSDKPARGVPHWRRRVGAYVG